MIVHFAYLLAAVFSAKSNPNLINNLVDISENFEGVLNEGNRFRNIDLLAAIEEYQSEVEESLEKDLDIKQLRTLTAKGNNLNLNAMITYAIGNAGVNKKKDGDVDGTNKWSEYGCFCTAHFEKMEDGNWVGKGEPVDRLDYLCRQLWWGYKCLSRDYTSCSAEMSYQWTLGKDSKPSCLDNEGTCRGDLCRLDLQFSAELAKMRRTWAKEFHLNNGFDRMTSCAPSKQKLALRSENSKLKSKNENKTAVQSECCGMGLMRSLYKPDRQQCCKDGTVRTLGSC